MKLTSEILKSISRSIVAAILDAKANGVQCEVPYSIEVTGHDGRVYTICPLVNDVDLTEEYTRKVMTRQAASHKKLYAPAVSRLKK